MPSSDERPDNINIVGLALSEGRREGCKFLTPRLRISPPSLHLRLPAPLHPHKGVKIPIYSDWSQEWAWKGQGQKAIFHGTKPLQWSCFDLIPPQPPSPVLLVPIELCHHATVIYEGIALLLVWMKQSTAIYSRQRFEVSGKSQAPGLHFLDRSTTLCSFHRFCFCFFLPLTKFKWPAGQRGQSNGAVREE